jgi:hypothetical protein
MSTTIGMAQDLDIFAKERVVAAIASGEVEDLLDAQEKYEPVTGEVFVDAAGDFYYLSGEGYWVNKDSEDGTVFSSSEVQWHMIVEDCGPLYYVGTVEDLERLNWKA